MTAAEFQFGGTLACPKRNLICSLSMMTANLNESHVSRLEYMGCAACIVSWSQGPDMRLYFRNSTREITIIKCNNN